MNEWITWTGGECPLDADVRIEIVLRNCQVAKVRAGLCDWSIEGDGGDILRYRVIEEEQA
jgi:hypothetical protein